VFLCLCGLCITYEDRRLPSREPCPPPFESNPANFFFCTLCLIVESFRGSKVECEQRKGVYMAAAAAILFFLAACFQCCSPHSADPFCFNFGRELERPEPRKKKETQTAVSEQDDRYEEPENDDYYVEEAEPTPPSPPPKRKPSTSKEMVEYKSPTKRKQSINRERRFD